MRIGLHPYIYIIGHILHTRENFSLIQFSFWLCMTSLKNKGLISHLSPQFLRLVFTSVPERSHPSLLLLTMEVPSGSVSGMGASDKCPMLPALLAFGPPPVARTKVLRTNHHSASHLCFSYIVSFHVLKGAWIWWWILQRLNKAKGLTKISALVLFMLHSFLAARGLWFRWRKK